MNDMDIPTDIYGNPVSGGNTDSGIGDALLVAGIVVVICVLIFAVAFIYHESSQADSDVYEDLDVYGGTIYLNESVGSSSSLVNWYVPQASNVHDSGDFVHIDKATRTSYTTDTFNLYIPKNAILYISINQV